MNYDRDAYLRVGKTLAEKHTDELSTQLATLQSALVNFATTHAEDIAHNPDFKQKYTTICRKVGIDPLDLYIYAQLTKPTKSDYVTALAVRIVEVCHETRDMNGGLISINELCLIINSSRAVALAVNEASILEAINLLGSLGKGYQYMSTEGKLWLKFVLAASETISNDQKKVFELCEFMGGFVTLRLLRDNYEWDKIRAKLVLDEMIMDGLLWLDQPSGALERKFWEPLFHLKVV